MKKESFFTLGSYATIYIVWGSTYFFIKMSVETIPPFYVVGLRFLFGGMIFFVISLLKGKLNPFPSLQEVLSSIILGTLLLIGGNGLVTMAERTVDSYLVALIIASTPIVIAFFNRVLFTMKLSFIKFTGILIGILGVAFLLYDGQSVSSSISPETLMVIGAAVSWGFATSLGHRMKVPGDNLVNTGIQMLFVGIVLTSFVTIFHKPLPAITRYFSMRSITGLLYLAVIGSLAFGAYNYLLFHEPSIRIVSYALVNPIIAVFLGLLVGAEEAVPFLFLGLPVILLGVFLMLYGEKLLAIRRA